MNSKTKSEKLTSFYLYADGHAVLRYEDEHPKAGFVCWVEIIENFGPKCRFEGRIAIGKYQAGLIDLIKKSVWVKAKARSTDNGSDRTKQLGIAVGSLEISLTDSWDRSLYFHDMDAMCGPYHYQPENVETFASNTVDADGSPAMFWSNYRIAAIHRTKPAVLKQAAA